MLDFCSDRAAYFPTRSRNIESQMASTMVRCLGSSKADIRASAEGILRNGVSHGTLSTSSIERGASRLKPAEQRKVRPVLDSLESSEIRRPQSVSRQSPSRRGSSRPRTSPNRPASSLSTKSPGRPGSSLNTKSPGRPGSSLKGRGRDRQSIGLRSRSISRSGRESLGSSSKKSSDSGPSLYDLINDPSFHPLKSGNQNTLSKSQRMVRQRSHQPEYPEMQSGNDLFYSLKKTWSPLLPIKSLDIFFPTSGIQKQEDAANGCELLVHAIGLVTADGEEYIFIDQLDLILRWFTYALCCRDNPVGMQSLISFLLKMIPLLRQQNYQLSDTESNLLLPYILEKAGAAKVRQPVRRIEAIEKF